MVSRENRVHLLAVLGAILVVIAAAQLSGSSEDTPVFIGLTLLSYGVLFGGAHLYLAWRGEEGTVPVRSRWRFLAALAAWLTLAAIGALGPDGSVSGVAIDTVVVWVGVAVLLVYWLLEARDGYLTSRPA